MDAPEVDTAEANDLGPDFGTLGDGDAEIMAKMTDRILGDESYSESKVVSLNRLVTEVACRTIVSLPNYTKSKREKSIRVLIHSLVDSCDLRCEEKVTGYEKGRRLKKVVY